MVTPRQIFDIVEIILYLPALVFAIVMWAKHSKGQTLSFVALINLALLRLIGASTGIAAVEDPKNTQLITCSLVCSFVGLSPLLATVISFTRRLHKNSSPASVIPAQLMVILQLPVLIGMIIGIVAGTKIFDPSTAAEGHHLSQAASIIYSVGALAIAIVILITFATRSRIPPSDNKLMIASLLVIPFIALRVVYQLCSSFDYTDTDTFSYYTDKTRPVLVEGLMSLLPEYACILIYLVAALFTEREQPVVHQDSEAGFATYEEQNKFAGVGQQRTAVRGGRGGRSMPRGPIGMLISLVRR